MNCLKKMKTAIEKQTSRTLEQQFIYCLDTAELLTNIKNFIKTKPINSLCKKRWSELQTLYKAITTEFNIPAQYDLLKRAFELFPDTKIDEKEYNWFLGKKEEKEGKIEKAVEYWKLAINEPNPSLAAYQELGFYAKKQNRFLDAIEYFKKIRSSTPEDSILHEKINGTIGDFYLLLSYHTEEATLKRQYIASAFDAYQKIKDTTKRNYHCGLMLQEGLSKDTTITKCTIETPHNDPDCSHAKTYKLLSSDNANFSKTRNILACYCRKGFFVEESRKKALEHAHKAIKLCEQENYPPYVSNIELAASLCKSNDQEEIDKGYSLLFESAKKCSIVGHAAIEIAFENGINHLYYIKNLLYTGTVTDKTYNPREKKELQAILIKHLPSIKEY